MEIMMKMVIIHEITGRLSWGTTLHVPYIVTTEIARTSYVYHRDLVCFRYTVVNTLFKGGKYNNNNNNVPVNACHKLRRLIYSLSPRWPSCKRRQVLGNFGVDKAAWERFFFEYDDFALAVSLYGRSIPVVIYMLLSYRKDKWSNLGTL